MSDDGRRMLAREQERLLIYTRPPPRHSLDFKNRRTAEMHTAECLPRKPPEMLIPKIQDQAAGKDKTLQCSIASILDRRQLPSSVRYGLRLRVARFTNPLTDPYLVGGPKNSAARVASYIRSRLS